MVEIFKTNVEKPSTAQLIVSEFRQHFPAYRVNFDLNDCDRILRIESREESVDVNSVIELARKLSLEIRQIVW